MELDYKYTTVKTFSDLKRLIKYCKKTGYCSSDFETNGIKAMYPESFPTILGVSFQPGYAWIIPLAHKDSSLRKRYKKFLKYFGREIIQNPNIIKIGQNIQFEYQWWYKYGIEMRGRVFDTMLAKYLLDEEKPHGLKSMVSRFLPEFDGYDLKGVPSSKAERDKIEDFWSNVDIDELSKYCALDSDLTFRLWVFFENRLIKANLYNFFRNMMMMGSRVLAEASYHGMVIDTDYLDKLVREYSDYIDQVEKEVRAIPIIRGYEKKKKEEVKLNLIEKVQEEIEELELEEGNERKIANREEKISRYIAGEFTNNKDRKLMDPINFGSPTQMIDLLFESDYGFEFDIVKYTIDKNTKRPTDRPSTDEEVLLILKEKDDTGFIEKLLRYRELTKMYSTYIKGIREKIPYGTNILYGSFLLHGTVTGRLSSRNPNLQNIPRDTTSAHIKKMFTVPKGKLMMQMDYSQAELRVLAFEAKEKVMMQWFKDNRDIHLASACLKNNWDYEERVKIYQDKENSKFLETKVERKKAKTINFGIVYQEGPEGLAKSLSTNDHQVTKEEAKQFILDFNTRYPRIAKYVNNQERQLQKYGYVKNVFGRKRRLPDIDSSDYGKRARALRQAVNSPIQGAASDFTLFSSIIIRYEKIKGNLPSSLVQVGTVHDSIIFYIAPEDIHKTIPKLYKIAKYPDTKEWFNFQIRGIEMKMDFEIGKTWQELEGYKESIDYTKWVD